MDVITPTALQARQKTIMLLMRLSKRKKEIDIDKSKGMNIKMTGQWKEKPFINQDGVTHLLKEFHANIS